MHRVHASNKRKAAACQPGRRAGVQQDKYRHRDIFRLPKNFRDCPVSHKILMTTDG